MPSSDRVILRRGSARPSQPSSPAPAAGRDRGDASPAPVAAETVIRGRPTRATRTPAGAPGSTAAGAAPTHQQLKLTASTSLSALANAGSLGPELRQMQRIAEERGYAQGRARAEAELRGAIDALEILSQRIEATAPREASEIAHAIVELSLAVARRVLEHEVHLDPTILCGALEQAVLTINGSPEAHVMLNPSTVGAVRAAWEARHGLSHLGKRWIFEADPNLPPGGCRLRYDHGFVDAGFEAQVEEIGIALDRAIPGFAGSIDPGAEDVA